LSFLRYVLALACLLPGIGNAKIAFVEHTCAWYASQNASVDCVKATWTALEVGGVDPSGTGYDWPVDSLADPSTTGDTQEAAAQAAIPMLEALPEIAQYSGKFALGACYPPDTQSFNGACTLLYTATPPPGMPYVGVQTTAVSVLPGCPVNYELTPDYMCVRVQVTVFIPPPKSCKANWGTNHPIHPTLGNETYRQPLGLFIGGEELSVNYDSANALWHPTDGSVVAQTGQLGKLWWGSWMHTLVLLPDGSLQTQRGAGRILTSTGRLGQMQTFGAEPDTFDGTFYHDQQQPALETISGNGVLRTRVDGTALAPSFSADASQPDVAPAAGLLTALTDSFGHSVKFTYKTLAGGQVAVATIADDTARPVSFDYDPSGNLSTVTLQDGSRRQFLYDSPNPNQAWALTGLVDEGGVRAMTVAYDPAGWARSSEATPGVQHFDISYASPPAPIVRDVCCVTVWDIPAIVRYFEWVSPTGVQVTDPAGSTSMMSVTTVNAGAPDAGQGSPRSAGFTRPPGAGCPSASDAIGYDPQGNIVSEDDYNGTRTCYGNDLSRHVVLQRLEGLPNSKACPIGTLAPAPVDAQHPERLTTTAWHPSWNLKVREAGPKRMDYWIYNGQPDPTSSNPMAPVSCAPQSATLPDGEPIVVLCRRITVATSDADGGAGLNAPTVGPALATNYTYNALGQVLSVSEPPRTAGGAVATTLYEYYTDTSFPDGVSGHTRGDLKAVTNPLGQVTQFTAYDRAGRLLAAKDANGVTTSSSYSARGWLVGQSTTAPDGLSVSTRYDYWPNGTLKTVTQPDGSSVSYVHDGAQRLTDVTDSLGNTVHYDYDGAGNKTAETVKDPSGRLAASIARTYDALGRVMTVVGAGR